MRYRLCLWRIINMKKISEKEIDEIEHHFKEQVWGNSYVSSKYASEASDKQKYYLNKLLKEHGYEPMTGSVRKGCAQALIWWLLGGKSDE